jgi:hypothetical protein
MRRSYAIGLVAAALVLLAARVALPHVLERWVEWILDRNAEYTGRVDDVDVALWRGAYALDGVAIEKRSGAVPVPFLACPRIDLSIHWRALFRGAVVGEVWFLEPDLNFVRGRSRATRQTGAGADWRAIVEALFPLRIDRVVVSDGRVHYRDFGTDPRVDVRLERVQIEGRNLTNSLEIAETRVAHVVLRAVPMQQGEMRIALAFDPFAQRPTFDLDATTRNVALTPWNDFFRAYAGLDVQRGSLDLYAELEASDGRFEGYLKPFLRDVDVLDFREEREEQGLLASLWEAIVGGGAELLEDQSEDQQAARIPIRGAAREPDVGFWPALGSAVRNAFVDALPEKLENSVGARR